MWMEIAVRENILVSVGCGWRAYQFSKEIVFLEKH
jgi:hypothetical protein